MAKTFDFFFQRDKKYCLALHWFFTITLTLFASLKLKQMLF